MKNTDTLLCKNAENGEIDRTAFIRYKSVIAELMKISYRIEARYTDQTKLRKYAWRLAERLLGEADRAEDCHGCERFCVLAKITENGYEYLGCNAQNGCEIIAIDDEYGAVADEIMSIIKNEAVSRNIDIICCYNPFLQCLERIIIGGSHTAVCRSSKFCRVGGAVKRIHAQRFCDKQLLAAHRQSLRFNDRIIKELLPNCHQNNK